MDKHVSEDEWAAIKNELRAEEAGGTKDSSRQINSGHHAIPKLHHLNKDLASYIGTFADLDQDPKDGGISVTELLEGPKDMGRLCLLQQEGTDTSPNLDDCIDFFHSNADKNGDGKVDEPE